jgi:hypothetical protein
MSAAGQQATKPRSDGFMGPLTPSRLQKPRSSWSPAGAELERIRVELRALNVHLGIDWWVGPATCSPARHQRNR